MTTMNEQNLKSSKFTIDNDRSNGSKLPEPIDDEIEEGEASPDEEGSPDREASPDIVKFNIIVGNAKQDIPNYGQRNEQFPTKNSISHSSSRSREFSFYRPPAVRDRLGPKGKYKSNHESESQRSLKQRSPVLEKEDIGLDFGPEEFEPSRSMLEERAKRFGIHLAVTKKQIQDLYKSLDISEDDFRRGGWRAEAIHVRGVEGLGSAEVFKYFKKFSPHSIEWHNKSSCNIVWLEKEQATKALLGLSCPIKPSKVLKSSTKLRSKKPVKNKEVKAAKPSLTIKSEGKEKKKSKKSSSNDSSSSSSDSSSSSSSSESEDEDGSSSDSSSSSSSSSGSSSSGSSSSSSSSDSEDEENSKEQPAAATAVAGHQQVPVFEANNNNSNNNDESPSEMEVDGPPLETQVPEEMDGSVSAEDIGVPIPPGRWRLGVPCPHTKAILMRFAHAHCKDKKLSGMEKPIELYQDFVSKKIKREFPREKKPERSYAKSPRVPRSYMDGTLRPLPEEPSFGRPHEDWVEKPPLPMGRHYKDLDDPIDENKNPWGFLAQNWGRKETQDNLDYKDLLLQHVTGQKRKRAPSDSEGEEEEEEEEEEERRFHRPIRPSQRLQRDRHKRHRVQYDHEYRYVDLDVCDDVEEEEEEEEEEEDVVAWRSKIKLPMMRMYADAEEKKKKKRQKKPRGIESRLGAGRASWKENPRPVSSSGDLRAKLERRKRIAT